MKLQTQRVTWKVRRAGDGYEGEVTIPMPVGPATITTTGRNRQEAVARAATLAKQITQNPLVASILPPGTPVAVEALQKLAQSPTGQTLKKFGGEGAKRLVKALRSIF